MAVIRSLAPDELPWFLSSSFAYLGHRDPWGLALRSVELLRQSRRDAARCWVLEAGKDRPVAGVVAWPPDTEQDDPTLRLAQPWHQDESPSRFLDLLQEVLKRHPHEAAELDVSALPAVRVAALSEALAHLGFRPEQLRTLAFELSEVPPIGSPLVLEAWRYTSDTTFRGFIARSEGVAIGDGRWAWLKRAQGPFKPDFCCLAYETLDQPPVGYALAGCRRTGVDGEFSLNAIGVAPEHRGSTEMLRRLLLSLLQELAGHSPLGSLRAEFPGSDPKLLDIMRSVGFEVGDPRPVLRKLPT